MNGILTYLRRIFWSLLVALSLASCGSSSNSVQPNLVEAPKSPEVILKNESPPVVMATPETFLEAAEQNLIEYQVAGLDASSGDSLRIRVRRRAARPMTLRITPGTVFRTGSRGVQRMVAFSVSGEVAVPGGNSYRPTDTIQLDSDEFREFIVKAYCLDFELENPSPGNSFTVQAIDQRAAAILGAASQRGLDVQATQAAIWLDRGLTGGQIRQKFEVTDEQLEQAGQVLAGLPRA